MTVEVARVLSVVLFTAGTGWLINAIRHMTRNMEGAGDDGDV